MYDRTGTKTRTMTMRAASKPRLPIPRGLKVPRGLISHLEGQQHGAPVAHLVVVEPVALGEHPAELDALAATELRRFQGERPAGGHGHSEAGLGVRKCVENELICMQGKDKWCREYG